MFTNDSVVRDAATLKLLMRAQSAPGISLGRRIETHDGKFVDTTGAFLVGELERLDLTANAPLFSNKHTRDLDRRGDVTSGDDTASFTQSTFAVSGGPGTGAPVGQKRSFIGKVSTELGLARVDIGKVVQPLFPWGSGVEYSLPELESAAQLGRPVDAQQIEALNSNHQLELDAQAYLGYAAGNTFGLVNSPLVSATNLPATGTGTSSTWASKTPVQVLIDLTNMVYAPWAASGYAVMPNRILLDPNNFSYISSTMIAVAGTSGAQSILSYFLQSNIVKNSGEDLKVLDCKWLIGGGAGGTLFNPATPNRAVVYRKEPKYVQFPYTALQATPVQYTGLFHKLYYWGRMGVVEFRYPETLAYFDGN